ncbi:hypothetical protein CBR_g37065 [Chara braunii]|uniref:Uncharacterized protein n=1 Tax=Chara braunii TaxID=69332 RepID=A0A388LM64_CHABU|nr:hypothetical protein CBR_g37065 [Chara braunii]|eukprot:GBG83351.1 hypothetical protein CBR_g37065 [Chara braunii]
MARSVRPQRLSYTNAVVGICAAGTDGGIHGGEEEMVDKGSAPLDVDATHVDEEGATVHAGHNAPSLQDGETGGHVEQEGATVDMSLRLLLGPCRCEMSRLENILTLDLGRPVSFSAGGYSGEMPRWDGGELGEWTPTPLHPEQLERLGTEDPFPFTDGQPSPPAWTPVSPRWTGSSLSDIRERESVDRQATVFSGGVASSHVQTPLSPLPRALHQGLALATGLPSTGGRGSGRGLLQVIEVAFLGNGRLAGE